MELVYVDKDILVCVKPARVLSTDEPGGVPDLAREALDDPTADVRTVHRLDRVVAGLMVLARNGKAASELSRQIREDIFEKEYLAVVHGRPAADKGTLTDLLYRDKALRKTFVTDTPAKGVQEAILDYETLERNENTSLVRIELITGRTHQIRCQFSHHGFSLLGDRKYGSKEDGCDIALWSHYIEFIHPTSKENMYFRRNPLSNHPWNKFEHISRNSK